MQVSKFAEKINVMENCIFCRIVAGEIPSKQIYADDTAIAFLDIQPAKPGHTLIVPRRHVANAIVDETALAEIGPVVATVGSMLMEKLNADGLNVLSNVNEVAGQSVFHLHVHLIPRFADNPGIAAMVQPDENIDVDAIYQTLIA